MLCTNVCLLSSDEVMSHFHPLILTGFYSTQGPSHLFLPRLQLSCKFMGGKKNKVTLFSMVIDLHYVNYREHKVCQCVLELLLSSLHIIMPI